MFSEQTKTGRGRPFKATAATIGDSCGGVERGPRWMENFKKQVDEGYHKFWAKRGIDSSAMGRNEFVYGGSQPSIEANT